MSMSTSKTSENANTISTTTTTNRALSLSTIRKGVMMMIIIMRIITTISIFRLLKALMMSTDKGKTRIQDSSGSEEDKSLLRSLEMIKKKDKQRKEDISCSNLRKVQALLLVKTVKTKRNNKLKSKEMT